MQDPNAGRLSDVRSYLLVGLIFEIIAVIVFLVFLLSSLVVVFDIVFIIPLIVSVVVLVRIRRMRIAAHTGDLTTLKRNNSVAWATIALIFAGIIPGVMLFAASGPINELAEGVRVGTFTPSQPQWTPGEPAGNAKFCTACGARMASSAAFCPSCGTAQK
jgi:hypothetical protein